MNTMGPLVRCSIAIRIPDSFWPKIQETQMAIRRKAATDVCRWNGQSDMMLTLCSLGEQQWESIKRIATGLGPICAKYSALNLKLEGLQGLPNVNQPRYVAMQVGGDLDGLKRLREELARTLGPLLPASEKEFTPLVILGRLKAESEQARTALGRAVRMSTPELIGQWGATEVQLLRADASTSGVQYQLIEKFGLTAAAGV